MRGPKIVLALLSAALLPSAFGAWNFEAIESVPVSHTESSNRAVAYIDGSGGKQYFSTIEKAVSKANDNSYGSRQVVVMSGISSLTKPIVINSSIELLSGSSLILPFDMNSATTVLWGNTIAENRSGTFSDSSMSSINQRLKTHVLLNDGVTLTVHSGASLIVGGATGTTGSGLSNHTSGLYAQISLGRGASIVCSGELQCAGYIKPLSETWNGETSIQFIKETNGSIPKAVVPLVVYDFKGGTVTSALYGKGFFPLEGFDFPNLSVPTTVNSGVDFQVTLVVYMSGSYTSPAYVNLISSSSSAGDGVINLTSGHVVFDYTPASVANSTVTVNGAEINVVSGLTVNDWSSPKFTDENPMLGKTSIVIEGSASMNDISASIGVNVTTSGKYMPFSYKLNITVNPGSYVFNAQTKFLPGSSVVVNEGAILNLQKNCIFYQRHDAVVKNSDGTPLSPYPSGLPAARLINNDSITANSAFGGLVETTVEDASIYFNYSMSASSEDANDNVSAANVIFPIDTLTVTEQARGYAFDGTTISSEAVDLSAYGSNFKSVASGSSHGWEAGEKNTYSVTVNIDSTTNFEGLQFSFTIGGRTYTQADSFPLTINVPKDSGDAFTLQSPNDTVGYVDVNGSAVGFGTNKQISAQLSGDATINIVPAYLISSPSIKLINQKTTPLIWKNANANYQLEINDKYGTQLLYKEDGTIEKRPLYYEDVTVMLYPSQQIRVGDVLSSSSTDSSVSVLDSNNGSVIITSNYINKEMTIIYR